MYCAMYFARNPHSTELHHLIRENYRQVFFNKEIHGTHLPFHLEREFKKYLTCGNLAFGLARFHCSLCQKDKLVAFSCKGRTLCPSCTGRRMSDTAKHLIEKVIPAVPTRQWVFSREDYLQSKWESKITAQKSLLRRNNSSRVFSGSILEITSLARPKKVKTKKKVYRTPWSELLKYVFKYEVSNCDHCGTKLTLVATITSQKICQKILNHIGRPTNEVIVRSPRAPPEADSFDQAVGNF